MDSNIENILLLIIRSAGAEVVERYCPGGATTFLATKLPQGGVSVDSHFCDTNLF